MYLHPSFASFAAVLLGSVTVIATTCYPDGCVYFQSDWENHLYKNDYIYPAQVKEMNIVPFTTTCCPKFDYSKFLLQVKGTSLTAEDGMCKCLNIGGIDHFASNGPKINDHIKSFVLIGNFPYKGTAFSAQFYLDSGCAPYTKIWRK